jgi:hypothetical protein
MNLTLAAAQAELATVNAALSDIYLGTRRKKVEIGSHAFKRTYEFVDPQDMLKVLRMERFNLTEYINTLTATTQVFRANTNIPMTVQRF